MRILISGYLPCGADESERLKFQEAEASLRKDGHHPINPAGRFQGILTPLPVRIHQLGSCDAIYLLKGYRESRECLLEKYYCELFGLKVIFESQTEKEEDEIDHKIRRIKKAIRTVTGLRYEKYRGGKRGRNEIYFARMIFSKHCADIGLTTSQVTRYVSRKKTTLRRHQENYKSEYEHNPRFREAARRISEILEPEVQGKNQ